VTAPLNKFRDAWDYYTQASSYQWIPGIKIPHLTLHSEDDPMVAPRNLPHKEIENSSHVVMASTHAGGHVAWFTDKESRWFTIPMKEWVLALLDVSGYHSFQTNGAILVALVLNRSTPPQNGPYLHYR
jgi:predicted alpha/beta-fold hydrolase